MPADGDGRDIGRAEAVRVTRWMRPNNCLTSTKFSPFQNTCPPRSLQDAHRQPLSPPEGLLRQLGGDSPFAEVLVMNEWIGLRASFTELT